eukprot:TRINITY_DN46052_c0_g1_i1.p1 TRINITY_DN46052_c0_g1~~TRINITY_DN46052_c0_g1_i1.p1  ORF type:complete len:312 (+),score=6.55 TRINITY_DN46052_c0_g1_i1:111-1046(+)
MSSVLDNGSTLLPDQFLVSSDKDKEWKAIFQTDGNFVVYYIGTGPPLPVWSTGTCGSGATRLVMQADNNLVMYRGSQTRPEDAVWSTGTHVDVRRRSAAIHWGRCRLELGHDGILRLMIPAPLWSSVPSQENIRRLEYVVDSAVLANPTAPQRGAVIKRMCIRSRPIGPSILRYVPKLLNQRSLEHQWVEIETHVPDVWAVAQVDGDPDWRPDTEKTMQLVVTNTQGSAREMGWAGRNSGRCRKRASLEGDGMPTLGEVYEWMFKISHLRYRLVGDRMLVGGKEWNCQVFAEALLRFCLRQRGLRTTQAKL